MKKLKTSFLFFFLLFISSLMMSQESYYSKKEADSVRYYDYFSIDQSTDLANGINNYIKLKEFDLFHHDTLRAIDDLRMIAIGQFKIGSIYDSESSVVEALNYMDDLKNGDTLIDSKIGLYNQLGRVYRVLDDSKSAIEVYDKALKVSKKSEDSITILINKANIYKDLKEYQSAIQLYTFAYDKSIKENNNKLLARALGNIGFIESKTNDSNALININRALEIRQQIKDYEGIYDSYKSLFYHFLDRKNKEKALLYANNAYNTAKKLKSNSYILDASSFFVELNDNPQVLEYKKLIDSTINTERLEGNKYASIKFNFEKQKREIQKVELDKEKEKSRRIVYQSIAAFIVLVSIFTILILRSKYKKGKLKERYNTERRISKKIHDEVANDVFHVINKFQSNSHQNILENLESIYKKTRDISRESSDINIKLFEDELLSLFNSYGNSKLKIITSKLEKGFWSSVKDYKKFELYYVLRELLINMKKHSKATLVSISFKRNKNKIIVKYADNGIGSSPLSYKGGLKNVESRIKAINGSINFETEPANGFKAIIAFVA